MIKTSYRRNLPHIYPVGATFFITFRLQNSLPYSIINKLKEDFAIKLIEVKAAQWLDPNAEILRQQKLFFKKYDSALDKIHNGVNYLKNPKVAKIVADKIHQYDGKFYELLCYCIMPNHVHLLIDTSIQIQGKDPIKVTDKEYTQVDKILKLIKGGSAYEINKLLNRRGEFWQKESYDHYVRSGKELSNIIWYIVKNPLKAGLVKDWEDYKFTYYMVKDNV